MRWSIVVCGAIILALSTMVKAEPNVQCTIVHEVGFSKPIIMDGECDQRISAASTFKIALSLMGFDSGILKKTNDPEWLFQEGYTDWNPAWREPTTPERWMRLSVVWFSQQITKQLGEKNFANYVQEFDYGNKDISGDKEKQNGLTNAWLSSSLQISPVEQIQFLTHMIKGELPVVPAAVNETKKLLRFDETPNGWHIFGKTGAGMPFDTDGNLLKGQPFGWYVGWAEKNERKIVFARLVKFSARPDSTPAIITREGLINRLLDDKILQ